MKRSEMATAMAIPIPRIRTIGNPCHGELAVGMNRGQVHYVLRPLFALRLQASYGFAYERRSVPRAQRPIISERNNDEGVVHTDPRIRTNGTPLQ
jgi:hypothetical protein